jgi:hypothetical protein
VCLVGGGQEINTGEAGISEWLDALSRSFPDWEVHVSSQIRHPDYLTPHSAAEFLGRDGVHTADDLHLSVSVRSFRAEKLSDFVGAVIEADVERSRVLLADLLHYPIVLTRDLSKARAWLRAQRRGMERAGLLASSNALRLKPEGIFVKAKIDPAQWFLARPLTSVHATFLKMSRPSSTSKG